MKRFLVFSLAMAFCCSAALATDLNVTVQGFDDPDWVSSLTVSPSATVEYRVMAELSDDPNDGLALIGFDLCFTGGALVPDPVEVPTTPPMANFVSDETQAIYVGISNPVVEGNCPPQCGYAGTEIGGCLVQVGGGQNTILNTSENAPFPVGTPIEFVAEYGSPVVVITGALTAPATDGTYYLNVLNLFANVVKSGESAEEDFWATEEIGTGGTINNLTVTVVTSAVVELAAAAPVHDGSLWRTEKNIIRLTFDGTLPDAPEAGEILIRELLEGGAYGSDLSANFAFTVEGGNVLRIFETTPALSHQTWYGISNDSWAGVGSFMIHHLVQVGDADGNKFVTPVDVGLVNGNIGPAGVDDSRFDVDGNQFVTPTDVGLANTHIGGFVAKPSGH